MSKLWHYSRGDDKMGPVSSDELKQLASKGDLLPTDLVWKEGTSNKIPAGSIKGLFTTNSNPTSSPSPLFETPIGKKLNFEDEEPKSIEPAEEFDYAEPDVTSQATKRSKKNRSTNYQNAIIQIIFDYLLFRRMITPILYQILFWLLVIGFLGFGFYLFIDGLIPQERTLFSTKKEMNPLESLWGIFCMLFGPILTRLLCEFYLLFFMINETLTTIKNNMNRYLNDKL